MEWECVKNKKTGQILIILGVILIILSQIGCASKSPTPPTLEDFRDLNLRLDDALITKDDPSSPELQNKLSRGIGVIAVRRGYTLYYDNYGKLQFVKINGFESLVIGERSYDIGDTVKIEKVEAKPYEEYRFPSMVEEDIQEAAAIVDTYGMIVIGAKEEFIKIGKQAGHNYNLNLLNKWGREFIDKKSYKEALYCFKLYLEKCSDNPWIYWELSLCYEMLNLKYQAIDNMYKAGCLLLEKGNRDSALTACGILRELYGEYHEANLLADDLFKKLYANTP
jgi:tetratricopeptide (TPR) repeat protein